MPTAWSSVRVREQSGRHMLVLSSSQFDPYPTSMPSGRGASLVTARETSSGLRVGANGSCTEGDEREGGDRD